MANNPALEGFINDLNESIDALMVIRMDCEAADRLWPNLNADAKIDIRETEQANLITAKTLVAALQVP